MTPPKSLTPDEAYARLADRCSTCEVCTGEALEKLRLWSIGPTEAARIVQRLVNERFIDDERFARAFVRDRLNNSRWGLVKIRHALSLKRIDRAIIAEAIESETDDERYFANLADALRSKGRRMESPLSQADRAKLMRFAVSRGYEPSLVCEMIADEEFWRNDDDQDQPPF